MGEAELILRIWGAKENTFRELKNFLSGIWGDQCIIYRDRGNTEPPPPPVGLNSEKSEGVVLLRREISLKVICENVKGVVLLRREISLKVICENVKRVVQLRREISLKVICENVKFSTVIFAIMVVTLHRLTYKLFNNTFNDFLTEDKEGISMV